MIRIFLFLLLTTCITSLYAINFRLGLMGGTNTSLNQLYTYNDITSTDSKMGYNANAFARFQFTNYILQPEVGYYINRVGLSVNEVGNSRECTYISGQMYTSVLMGFKFSKLNFSIGPMISFTTNQSFDALTSQQTMVQQINEGRATLGAMVNLGIDISKRWSIDLRANRTFTQSEFNSVIDNKSFNFSGNTGTLSLMIGYSIFRTP